MLVYIYTCDYVSWKRLCATRHDSIVSYSTGTIRFTHVFNESEFTYYALPPWTLTMRQADERRLPLACIEEPKSSIFFMRASRSRKSNFMYISLLPSSIDNLGCSCERLLHKQGGFSCTVASVELYCLSGGVELPKETTRTSVLPVSTGLMGHGFV